MVLVGLYFKIPIMSIPDDVFKFLMHLTFNLLLYMLISIALRIVNSHCIFIAVRHCIRRLEHNSLQQTYEVDNKIILL